MSLNKIFIKNILFPLMNILKGNNIIKNLDYLKKTQTFSHNDLEKLQEDKLKKILLHSINNISAYKQYKNLENEINNNPKKALLKINILDKATFKNNEEKFLDQRKNKSELILNSTGGSTGQPTKFYMDRHTVEFYEAARWRGLSWHNIEIGDSSAMIWGSPIELSKNAKIKYKLKDRFLKNRIVVSAYEINENCVKKYVKLFNKFKPVYFYGYASAIYVFAQIMTKLNLSLKKNPIAVICTAETIHDYQRELIEKTFNCKVVGEYGARDGGIICYECICGNYHLSYENAYIEVVDIVTKQPVENEKEGLILVTDLNNFSMPRLRYQLGDIISLSNKSCKCGVNLPLVKKIEGRLDDTLISFDGSFVHPHFFNHIARDLDGIKKFQIIQHDKKRLTLKIEKENNFKEETGEKFKNEIIKNLGPINITIDYVDLIENSKSGKFRCVIREFEF